MKAVKRTAMLIEQHEDGRQWIPTRTITCEVTGEMIDGSKVWTEVETGKQYYLARMLGTYMFYHI